MGLKSFLQDQGFIAKDEAANGDSNTTNTAALPTPMAPVIFTTPDMVAVPPPGNTAAVQQPAFVQELPADASQAAGESVDPAFIKFYEDELTKVNLPGPDYYEFRQQMLTMHQKMAGKGVSPEVILQAVLTSFEAQNIPAAKLVEAARYYKDALNAKRDSFLKGAAAEKDNQLQKRSGALQLHQNNIDACSKKLQELHQQMRQLEESIAKAKTQMDIDKTLGKEGIEKIERAERQIALAYTFMNGIIDKDIRLLQSS